MAAKIKKMFFSGFFSDFKKTFRPHPCWPPRIDEWGRVLGWPLVFILAKFKIRPEGVVCANLVLSIFLALNLGLGWHQQYPMAMGMLLFLRMTLDCVDGGLARYRNQQTLLGGAFDMLVDFFSILFIFGGLFIFFTLRFPTVESGLLATTGLLSCFLTSTICSLFFNINLKSKSGSPIPEAICDFVYPWQDNKTRIPRIIPMLYKITWLPFSRVAAVTRDWENLDFPYSDRWEHLFALGGFGTHFLGLGIILFLQIDLRWWIACELATLFLIFCLVFLLKRRPLKF